MMNPVVHFEMPYRDRDRAATFYSAAFGWETQNLGPEMGDYLLVTTADADVRPGTPAGAINGGLFPFKPDWPAQYPSVVVGVEDIRAAVARVGVAAVAFHGALQEISRPGGGTVESYPEDVDGRSVSASFLHNASAVIFEKEGFTRDHCRHWHRRSTGHARMSTRC